jgi:hypothetical protein
MLDCQHLESPPQRRPAAWCMASLVAGAILAAALPPRPAAAQGVGARLYQVEVVIFEQPSGTSIERPPRAAPATPHGDADRLSREGAPGELDEAAEPAAATLELPAGFAGPGAPLKLANVAARMNSGGFRLLWHQAWIQPATGGEGPELALLAALGQGRAQPEISGTVTLTAGRFLHLGFALELRTAQGVEAELQHRRRVRFGEEHYFDNPRIGVIALVSPLSPTP